MSSLKSDRQLISKSLPIAELIKGTKHCFRERDFNELQVVLMEREENFKKEIENLKRDTHSAEKVVGLLDGNGVPVVLERIQYEEELGKTQMKCHELEVVVTRLNEGKRLLTDQVKFAEERCDRIFTENMILTNEKNNLISELNEKIKELENKNLESERLAGVHREKCNNSISELNEKIKELENKNLESERLAGVYLEKCTSLDSNIAKMDQELEDLRQRKLEELKLANKTIEELRLEKIESDKKAELFKSRLENSSTRIHKIEENYAKMMNMRVGDIATWANDLGKFGTSEVGLNLDSQGLTIKNENSSGHADGKVVNGLSKKGDRNSVPPRARVGINRAHKVKPSRGKQSGHNPPQEENHKPKEPSGDRTSVPPRARACIDAHKVKASSSKQSGHGPPQEVNHEPKELLFSGVHTCSKQLISSSRKSACSCPAAAGTIIEISDSDDETNPGGVTHISNRVFLDTKVVKNKANLVPARLSRQTSKRNRTDCVEGQLTAKRKGDMCTGGVDNTVSTHEKENHILKPTHFGIDSSLEKIKVASDKDSEDESLSDAKMMALGRNLGREFTCEADMLKAFQLDEVFCMNAVCALYRQHLSVRESKERLNSSKNGGFSPSDSVSGCGLAQYLIDGDKEFRMRKSSLEVKKQHPEFIDLCRKLAIIYVEKLFVIHRSKVDPFFG